ncbi:hypothetical protein H2241_15960 [Pantoea ananatis]|uniref:hypothetical protein n=1 Tax=Pantoea ananas TaxID=553 RepID=UPI0015887CA8|nr:hypothetical protein [Pantoea ananatis]MBA4822445.1 hypothetical protein [Pantoea ananatis]QKV87629.1 hypothetical protein FOB88_11055 [Pantoea ananatis]
MQSDALAKLAEVMRKSDLKKRYLKPVKLITPLQSAWVRCLLDMWGEKYGGSVGPDGGKINVIGRLMIRKEWNDRESARIIEVVDNLHKQGYKGNDLFLKAQQLINPQNSVSSLLERANEQEDADLVESVICRIFEPSNPIRHVAIKYYCERKCSQDIAIELSRLTGMHPENAKTRIKWCRQLLEASVFNAIMVEMQVKSLNCAA